MFKHYPTLYKKTSKGAIQQWKIDVKDNKITTTYGQVGGKMQVTVDVINFGKNIGKRNETTPEEQAISEADSKWQKKKDQGFTETIVSAENEEHGLDGIDPMLAHRFDKYPDKISYPCMASEKLDGIRLIAVIKNHKCKLFSRNRKEITSLPHIVEELEKHFNNIILDGEAFNTKFKTNFEEIVSLVKSKEPKNNYKDIQFHVFDVVNSLPFYDNDSPCRLDDLNYIDCLNLTYVKTVKQFLIHNDEEVIDLFNKFRSEGAEGLMLRNIKSPYEHKRSYNLLKVKEMQDSEFKIIGVNEGKGKLSGHVGSFRCVTEDGKEFDVKLTGNQDILREYFLNPQHILGKLLTVQYQNLTNEGIPRFPIGIRIRNDI